MPKEVWVREPYIYIYIFNIHTYTQLYVYLYLQVVYQLEDILSRKILDKRKSKLLFFLFFFFKSLFSQKMRKYVQPSLGVFEFHHAYIFLLKLQPPFIPASLLVIQSFFLPSLFASGCASSIKLFRDNDAQIKKKIKGRWRENK